MQEKAGDAAGASSSCSKSVDESYLPTDLQSKKK
jgi:hypothetical protein